jgi:hypothetical protein
VSCLTALSCGHKGEAKSQTFRTASIWRRRKTNLEQAAQDHFTFLVEDKGFSLGATERTAYNSTLFRYLQAPLCLEIEMDFRDHGVDVFLLKLDGPTVPKKRWMISQPDKRIPFLTLLRDVLRV